MKLTDFTKTQFIFLLLCMMRIVEVLVQMVNVFKPSANVDEGNELLKLVKKLERWLYGEEEESDDI